MQLESIAQEAQQFQCDCAIPEGQRILRGSSGDRYDISSIIPGLSIWSRMWIGCDG